MSLRKNRAAAVVVLALSTIVATGHMPVASGARQAPAATPLQLFQKMLPVIRHPRCVNCHGGLDPRSPAHRGQKEVIDGQSCESCHVDVPSWELPVADHSFVGKTDKELCGLLSSFADRMGHALFVSNHLVGDTLIGAAFVGLMAGARDPGVGTPPGPPADPPPMKRAAWVNLGKDWLNQGQGACEVEGTITQEETVNATDVWSVGPNDYSVVQSGKRTVTISLSGGQFRANIKVGDTTTTTLVTRTENAQGLPCTVTSTNITGISGTSTGVASVSTEIIPKLFSDTKPPQKDYRIDVTLPPERTQKRETSSTANGCGGAIASGTRTERPETLDWPEYTFTIEGHLQDPSSKNLFGACDKMVKRKDVRSDSVEKKTKLCNRFADVGNSYNPGLLDHGVGGSNHDGSDIPFRVVTFWNIAYRK